ncbi:hypothetical protein [Plectonema radiosum]|nr:hypothetical protein [Plectonema radiosum]
MKILLRLKNLSYIQPIYQSIDQIHHMAIAYSTYSLPKHQQQTF